MNAVGGQLGVDPEDVRITDVTVDERGAVSITYQVADVDPMDQITVQKGAESMVMADIIAANLQQAGFDQVEVEPADAQITSVQIVEFPEPEPAAPEQVIMAQQEFQGVTPDQAQGADFQDAVEQAVADQLDIDPEMVTVTSVTTNDEGHVVVVYVVQGVEPEDMDNMQQQMESGDMADAIGDNLQDAGFKGADVEPADAAPATVEITQEPVIESAQTVSGVSLDQAQSEEFQDAFEEGVAGKLGVGKDEVEVTGVARDDDGDVVVTYQITGVDTLDQIDTAGTMESEGMASAIADNLQDAGFKRAEVEPADAEITTVEVIEMPGDGPDGPVPVEVLMAQQEFQGIPPNQAESEDFQDAVEQAVADQLDIDPEFVTVTSVTTNDDGNVVVVYVVQNPPEDAEDDLESRDMAEAIGGALQEAGFDDAQVSPADAAPATVEVTQEPVIESEQPVNGVTLDQAQGEVFQEAFEEAVAEQLGVDPEDVDVTDVSRDEDTGAINVTYQVTGTYPPVQSLYFFCSLLSFVRQFHPRSYLK